MSTSSRDSHDLESPDTVKDNRRQGGKTKCFAKFMISYFISFSLEILRFDSLMSKDTKCLRTFLKFLVTK